jgi:hypothetical protein
MPEDRLDLIASLAASFKRNSRLLCSRHPTHPAEELLPCSYLNKIFALESVTLSVSDADRWSGFPEVICVAAILCGSLASHSPPKAAAPFQKKNSTMLPLSKITSKHLSKKVRRKSQNCSLINTVTMFRTHSQLHRRIGML